MTALFPTGKGLSRCHATNVALDAKSLVSKSRTAVGIAAIAHQVSKHFSWLALRAGKNCLPHKVFHSQVIQTRVDVIGHVWTVLGIANSLIGRQLLPETASRRGGFMPMFSLSI